MYQYSGDRPVQDFTVPGGNNCKSVIIMKAVAV